VLLFGLAMEALLCDLMQTLETYSIILPFIPLCAQVTSSDLYFLLALHPEQGFVNSGSQDTHCMLDHCLLLSPTHLQSKS
jgi:hypothetical protein